MTNQDARDRLLDATLPHVPDEGWSDAALRAGQQDLGAGTESADLVFPRGPRDAVVHFSERADRSMSATLDAEGFSELRMHERVERLVLARLEALSDYREAVRRGLHFFALPTNSALGLRLLSQTVDEIWYLAGDRSSDFSYYTKRALLAAVVSATTLYWLDDDSEGRTATGAFLSRKLAGVMLIHRTRGRLERVDRLAKAACRGIRDAFDARYGGDGGADKRVT